MTDAWYLGRNGKQLGPYRWRVIQALAATGRLSPRDYLWCDGMPEWVLVAAFPELNAARAAMPAEPVAGASRPPRVDRRRRNYLLRHWRGQLSLPISYWVNGTLATLVVVALTAVAGLTDTVSKLGAVGTGAWLLGVLTIAYALTIWQLVGIWRSAGHHVERGGQRGWAVTAQIMVGFGVLGFLGQGIEQLPLWKESVRLVAGREEVPKAEFRVLNRATELELSGGMAFGTATSLDTLLQATPSIRLIHLNNGGGWISEGEKIERLIHDRGLITYTGRECASACLMAFLGGKERLLAKGARLGFHQASVGGSAGPAASPGNDQFRSLFRRKGLPEDFIRKALSAAPDDMWYPTDQELLEAGVITEVVDPKNFAQTNFAAWRSRDAIAAELGAVPLMAAIRQTEPETYAAIEKVYVDGVRDGATQADLNARTHQVIVDRIIPKYLRIAPDEPLVGYWKTQIAEVDLLGRDEPRYCLEFMGVKSASPAGDVSSRFPRDLLTEDLESLRRVILGAAAKPARTPPERDIAVELQSVMARAEAASPGTITVLAHPSRERDPARVCRAVVAFYRALLSQPGTRSGPLLRYLASKGE